MNLFKNCVLLSRKILMKTSVWLVSLVFLQTAYADPAQTRYFYLHRLNRL